MRIERRPAGALGERAGAVTAATGHDPVLLGAFCLLVAALRPVSPAAAEAASRAGRRLLGDQAALGKCEMLLPD